MYLIEQLSSQWKAQILASFQEGPGTPGWTPEAATERAKKKEAAEGNNPPTKGQLEAAQGQTGALRTRMTENRDEFQRRAEALRATGETTEQMRERIEGERDIRRGEVNQAIAEKTGNIKPEIAKKLGERGIAIVVDREIGGKSEAEMLSEFLGKNPDVDGKKLYESVAGKFPGMSETEVKQLLADMTPEEYNKMLEESVMQMNKMSEEEKRTGKPIDATRELPDGTTETNAFSMSGVPGMGDSRPMAYSGGESGTFDAPEISNKELETKVRALAGKIGAQEAALLAVVAVESGGKMNATRYEPHHGHKGRDEATSFGAFQIMGFNAKSLGYASAADMKEKFSDPQTGADEQVKAFGEFLRTRNLVQYIAEGQEPNFPKFASGYNGTGYAKMGYHHKMEAAYRKYNVA